MALSRRTGARFQASIWPGFVDAMTGLLLVLMFLLTIFMVVQYVLRETISGQESELDVLSAEVTALADALGLEERRSGDLSERVGALNATLTQTEAFLDQARQQIANQTSVIAALTTQRDSQAAALQQAQSQITGFEAQVATLLADQDRAQQNIAELTAERTNLLSEQETLNLALAQSRSEIDAQSEAARLAAARRDALEAMVADLQRNNTQNADDIAALQQQLSDEETARLTEAAAANVLRERLQNADAELTAMTLSLEAQRKEAEDTLTLLAAAEAARNTLDADLTKALATIAAAQTQAGQRDELVDRLTNVLNQMEVSQAENSRSLAALESDLSRVRQESAAAETELRNQLTAAQTLAADTRDALETELARQRAQTVQSQSEYETELARLQQENTETRRQLEARLVALQSDGDAAQEGLRAQLAEANAARDSLQTALDRTQADLDATRQSASTTAQDRADVEARLLNALEALERAQIAATDQEVLQARLATALAAQKQAESTAFDRAELLEQARETLSEQKEISAQAQRQTALLNQQIAALRTQLGGLQALLDDYEERDAAAKVQLENLGSDLNAALARAASEERRRRLLEESERKRLEAEARALQAKSKELEAQAQDLQKYRSEFFGRLRDLLGNQDGVRIEGDRFVFSSEVLFPPGGADLSVEGEAEIAKVARILRSIAAEIPAEIDWVIRVDGHTDDIPLISYGRYRDNWELSQGRALSVVRYMVDFLGIAPDRLSANGFGQYQPLNTDDTPQARAQNRRIELKLTEK